MSNLSKKEIEKFSNKILDDYYNKNPGSIFKVTERISNVDALLIQSNVSNFRLIRGEDVIFF